jgi:hypothetical protein
VVWVASIAKLTAGEVVAIDGKTLCGMCQTGKKNLVHMVSAWARQQPRSRPVRGGEKSNEITAIPKLLDALELSGTVVTIDAMGCQRAIAEKIIDRKADYILAVKENQKLLLDDIRDSSQMLATDAVAEEVGCGHRRVETQRSTVGDDLTLLERAGDWAGRIRWCASKPALSQGHRRNRTRDTLLHH